MTVEALIGEKLCKKNVNIFVIPLVSSSIVEQLYLETEHNTHRSTTKQEKSKKKRSYRSIGAICNFFFPFSYPLFRFHFRLLFCRGRKSPHCVHCPPVSGLSPCPAAAVCRFPRARRCSGPAGNSSSRAFFFDSPRRGRRQSSARRSGRKRRSQATMGSRDTQHGHTRVLGSPNLISHHR